MPKLPRQQTRTVQTVHWRDFKGFPSNQRDSLDLRLTTTENRIKMIHKNSIIRIKEVVIRTKMSMPSSRIILLLNQSRCVSTKTINVYHNKILRKKTAPKMPEGIGEIRKSRQLQCLDSSSLNKSLEAMDSSYFAEFEGNWRLLTKISRRLSTTNLHVRYKSLSINLYIRYKSVKLKNIVSNYCGQRTTSSFFISCCRKKNECLHFFKSTCGSVQILRNVKLPVSWRVLRLPVWFQPIKCFYVITWFCNN